MAFHFIELGWNADLPRPEKTILAILGSYANKEGENAFPSVGTIALKSGYSPRHTQRILGSLVRQGIIENTRRSTRYTPNCYRIVRERLPLVAGATFRDDKSNVSVSSGMTFAPPRGDNHSGEGRHLGDIRNKEKEQNHKEEEENPKLNGLLQSWEEIKNDVRSQISAHAFDTWIRPLRIRGIDGARLLLTIPNPHFSLVTKHYGATILRSATEAGLAVSQLDLCTQN